jgi:DNA-binding transcriptional LysR family regulator
MGLDLIELETFVAVAQTRSFSAAAQRLHVTQTTVSGRIQRLESTLGTKLLIRTTRRVEPSADGTALFEEASRTLEALSRLVHGFRVRAALQRQRVVVAATPTLAALTLAPMLRGYAQRFSDVEVEMLDLQYDEVLAAVEEGTADLAVLALETESAPFRFEPLWSDDMLLVVPQGHPLAGRRKLRPAELAAHPMMVLAQYEGLRQRIADAAALRGSSLPPAKVVANLNTLLGMLEANLGVTILPRFMSGRPEVAQHVLVDIEGVDLSRQFGIVTARRATPGTACQSFCQYLRESAPRLLSGAAIAAR